MSRTRGLTVLLVSLSLLVLSACGNTLTPGSTLGSASPCPGVINAAGQCVSPSPSPSLVVAASPSASPCPGVMNAAGQCVVSTPAPSVSPSPVSTTCPGTINAAGQCVTATVAPTATTAPTTAPTIAPTVAPTPSPSPCPGVVNAAGQCVTITPSPSPSASVWPMTATVNIYNPMTPFGPQTVNIGVGGTVTFNNVNSGQAWTIISFNSPTFPSVSLAPSLSTGITAPFTVPGNYEYVISGSPSFVVHGHIIVN